MSNRWRIILGGAGMLLSSQIGLFLVSVVPEWAEWPTRITFTATLAVSCAICLRGILSIREDK